jgi:dTDP-4-dehydrorhamnose reductase
MRILLIGSAGQVGQELSRTLPMLGQVFCLSRESLDLTDLEGIAPMVLAQRPNIIVNAAAYTAVDRAEQEPDLVHCLNAEVPTRLAETAEQLSATLVHLSTDYVFNGRQSTPYREIDQPDPQNVYGQSKLAGEEAIRHRTANHLILRTAWVYGAGGTSNFVKTILRLIQERDELQVVCDRIGSPTWAVDLSRAAIGLLSQLGDNILGTYHYTNSGVASWYDLAVAICEEVELLGYPLKVKRIIPIPTEQYPTLARRPSYSILACEKISHLLGHPAPHWRVSLRAMLRDYLGLAE